MDGLFVATKFCASKTLLLLEFGNIGSQFFFEYFRHHPKWSHFAGVYSVILYTGCDCYGDLRFTQRNGDVKKWKYFDASLFDALKKLENDPNQPQVEFLYSGMQHVAVDKKKLGNTSMFCIIFFLEIFNKVFRV